MVKHQTEANLPVENLTNKQTNKQNETEQIKMHQNATSIHSHPVSTPQVPIPIPGR